MVLNWHKLVRSESSLIGDWGSSISGSLAHCSVQWHRGVGDGEDTEDYGERVVDVVLVTGAVVGALGGNGGDCGARRVDGWFLGGAEGGEGGEVF